MVLLLYYCALGFHGHTHENMVMCQGQYVWGMQQAYCAQVHVHLCCDLCTVWLVGMAVALFDHAQQRTFDLYWLVPLACTFLGKTPCVFVLVERYHLVHGMGHMLVMCGPCGCLGGGVVAAGW